MHIQDCEDDKVTAAGLIPDIEAKCGVEIGQFSKRGPVEISQEKVRKRWRAIIVPMAVPWI